MTTTVLRFELPAAEDGDLASGIRALLERDDRLRLALTTNVKRCDRLAVYIDGTFAIKEVTVKDNGDVRVHASFEWEAFYGCNDLRRHDVEKESIPGRYENGELVLRIWFPEPRSTADEL